MNASLFAGDLYGFSSIRAIRPRQGGGARSAGADQGCYLCRHPSPRARLIGPARFSVHGLPYGVGHVKLLGMDELREKKVGPAVAIAGMLVVAIVYLRWQGRVWWCEQGDGWPVSFRVDSPHNSQHILDPYSFSHLLHGVLFFGFFWLFRARMSFRWRLVAATAVEVAWEMMENSPFVIDRYRAATIAVGYEGDSITNSLGDVLSFVAGFYLAERLGLWKSVLIFFVVDLAMLAMIRDNLTLNVLMLLWPIDAIRRWQAVG